MSLHDFSHGPYDDFVGYNLCMYDSSSDDEYWESHNAYAAFSKYCNLYMKTYNETCSSFISFERLYKAISLLEQQLNINEDDRLQQNEKVSRSQEFDILYKPIISELDLRHEFDEIDRAVNYIKQQYESIEKFSNQLFEKRLSVCKYLRELGEKANVPVENWKQINALLSNQ